MTREEFIALCDGKEKMIRTEYGFSQQKMSEVIGISKKKLVEIEKGRRSLGWTGSVALCSIFSDSDILETAFGGYPEEIIKSLAFDQGEIIYKKTMGGHVWWRELEQKNGYKIQQNIISKHYRILDQNNQRIGSSFDYEEIKLHLDHL
mgnify:FL=1|nr:transcriptional regulator [uncultured Anaerostipes sp.]